MGFYLFYRRFLQNSEIMTNTHISAVFIILTEVWALRVCSMNAEQLPKAQKPLLSASRKAGLSLRFLKS